MTRLDDTKLYLDFDHTFTTFSVDECDLFCLSERDTSLIIGVLRQLTWNSRIVNSAGNRLDKVGRTADMVTAIEYVEDLQRRLLVGCGDEFRLGLEAMGLSIKQGLETLGKSIYNKPCCNNAVTNIVQGTTGGGLVQYGSQQPSPGVGDGTGDVPEGFDTWEEYYTYKCRVANWIVDSLISTYANLSVMQLVGLTVTSVALGAALAGIAPFIPVAAIPLLIACLVGLGLSLSVLDAISDYLIDNRDDLVCGLYNADSTSAAVDIVATTVDEALEALLVSDLIKPIVRQLAVILASTDLLNTLFTDSLKVNYPDADCSGCSQEGEFTLSHFNYDQSTQVQMDVTWLGSNDFVGTLPAPIDNAWDPDGLIWMIETPDHTNAFNLYTIDFEGWVAMSGGTGLTARIYYSANLASYSTSTLITYADLKTWIESHRINVGGMYRLLVWSGTGNYNVSFTATVIPN